MRTLACLAALTLAAPATAHPHIFVGAEVTVVFDGDGPPAIRLGWVYDDFFSLLITSDLGIDLDGDLELTEAEKTALNDAITEWPPGFEGDLEVRQGETLLPLAPKRDHSMTYVDGIVRETHTRDLAALTDPAAPLTIRVFDPYYYVAYDVVDPVRIEGRDDCVATITEPDLAAAEALAVSLLGRPAAEVGPDEEFPSIGGEFAQTITVTCATPL